LTFIASLLQCDALDLNAFNFRIGAWLSRVKSFLNEFKSGK